MPLQLLLAILSALPARADGGVVRVREAQGPFLVTVFTPFQVSHSTPTEISILVQRRDTQEIVLDANVDLHLIPLDGGAIHPTDPICGSANQAMLNALTLTTNNSLTVRALRARGSAQFLYVAQVLFPSAGDWQFQASVQERSQTINITGPLTVGSPAGRLASLWPYLALPPLGIVLFAVNQGLLRRRVTLPLGKTRQGPGRTIPPTESGCVTSRIILTNGGPLRNCEAKQ
jgi:hypothetical protein